MESLQNPVGQRFPTGASLFVCPLKGQGRRGQQCDHNDWAITGDRRFFSTYLSQCWPLGGGKWAGKPANLSTGAPFPLEKPKIAIATTSSFAIANQVSKKKTLLFPVEV